MTTPQHPAVRTHHDGKVSSPALAVAPPKAIVVQINPVSPVLHSEQLGTAVPALAGPEGDIVRSSSFGHVEHCHSRLEMGGTCRSLARAIGQVKDAIRVCNIYISAMRDHGVYTRNPSPLCKSRSTTILPLHHPAYPASTPRSPARPGTHTRAPALHTLHRMLKRSRRH